MINEKTRCPWADGDEKMAKYHDEVWGERGDTMYYPQGVTDPDYCVIKFTTVKGRYYSKFKSEGFEI